MKKLEVLKLLATFGNIILNVALLMFAALSYFDK